MLHGCLRGGMKMTTKRRWCWPESELTAMFYCVVSGKRSKLYYGASKARNVEAGGLSLQELILCINSGNLYEFPIILT